MLGPMRDRWTKTGRSAAALRVAVGYAALAAMVTTVAWSCATASVDHPSRG